MYNILARQKTIIVRKCMSIKHIYVFKSIHSDCDWGISELSVYIHMFIYIYIIYIYNMLITIYSLSNHWKLGWFQMKVNYIYIIVLVISTRLWYLIIIWVIRINVSRHCCHILNSMTSSYIWIYTGAIFRDDVMVWKHVPHYYLFVWGIDRSLVDFLTKGQKYIDVSLMVVLTISWTNSRVDLGRRGAHMSSLQCTSTFIYCYMDTASDQPYWLEGLVNGCKVITWHGQYSKLNGEPRT